MRIFSALVLSCFIFATLNSCKARGRKARAKELEVDSSSDANEILDEGELLDVSSGDDMPDESCEVPSGEPDPEIEMQRRANTQYESETVLSLNDSTSILVKNQKFQIGPPYNLEETFGKWKSLGRDEQVKFAAHLKKRLKCDVLPNQKIDVISVLPGGRGDSVINNNLVYILYRGADEIVMSKLLIINPRSSLIVAASRSTTLFFGQFPSPASQSDSDFCKAALGGTIVALFVPGDQGVFVNGVWDKRFNLPQYESIGSTDYDFIFAKGSSFGSQNLNLKLLTIFPGKPGRRAEFIYERAGQKGTCTMAPHRGWK